MHEQTTLGQRIQEGRRAAGLSQEALGERLNVSRQAVSKWEADAAIPELENLIAMSRIFGVSIGRLLGVEPEQAEEVGPTEQPPEDGGLTEKELAAVEAIAAKYAEAAQQHQRPRWTRRQKLAATGLAVLLVLAADMAVKRQMDAIDRRLNAVQDQVTRIESSVAGQVDSLAGQMSNILDEKNHILANYRVTVTDFDPGTQTVTLCVTASPKEWTDTTTAVFTAALSDGRQFTAEAAGQNGTFTAAGFVVPMDQAIQLSVALLDGGNARTGTLETLHDCLPGNFSLHVVVCGVSASWSGNRIQLSGLDLRMESPSDFSCQLAPVAVDLCLYRNREMEPEQVQSISTAVELFQTVGYVQMYSADGYSTSFTLDDGETMTVALRVTDNYGQTTWTVVDAYSRANGLNSSLDCPSGAWVPGDKLP